MATIGERVGVFGGTFDPPHLGHAVVAHDLLDRLALDRLLVIPAPRPPHRSAIFSAETRRSLVHTLFADEPAIVVDDREFRREGPSFAVDTLAELREELPEVDLTFVIGADQLAVIDEWHEYRRLPELATIAVMRRDGEEPRLPDGAASFPYIDVEVTRIDLSASEVRERLRAGRSIRFIVPETIRNEVESAWRDRTGRQENGT